VPARERLTERRRGYQHNMGYREGVALVLAGAFGLALPGTAMAGLRFAPPVKLKGARDRSEPRIAITPDDRRWIITSGPAIVRGGAEWVYGSSDRGRHWKRTPADPPSGPQPSFDLDIAAIRTGRLIAIELDYAGISFYTSYSDDGGRHWTRSVGGAQSGDTDRPWLAVGPDDPTTHEPRVYLLYHNLGSGSAQHNMFVVTSRDGGATFDAPVPITDPVNSPQAYQDLQCADSGGPSSLSVNPRTGRVYAVWGTRSAPFAGGCGASVFGPFEINVVAATRVWVATSPDNSMGSWRTVKVVDDTATNRIVGMQLSPATLDRKGNVYVTYPESRRAYPDYGGAAIKYIWSTPALRRWSRPATVARGGGVGNVLPHVLAGSPGKLDFVYWHGVSRGRNLKAAWFTTAAQTLNGRSAHPHVTRRRVSAIPTYTGTASELMGACKQDPLAGVENGFVCTRSPDVFGVALDRRCRLTIAWPTRDMNAYAADQGDKRYRIKGNKVGTFASTQNGGTALCGSHRKKKHRHHRHRHRCPDCEGRRR